MNDLLIKLLRIALRALLPEAHLSEEDMASLRDPETLAALYRLAAPHDLQHMVGAVLHRLGVCADAPIAASFKQAQILAAYRYENRAHALRELEALFGEIKIPYIPLKGALISRYYPAPEMRTSCDIDILVKSEDLEQVSTALIERLAYAKQKAGGHDVQFVSPLGVHLELHFTLAEEKDTSPAAEILRRVWDVVTPAQDAPCRMEMPLDFAYFYHLAHMAKHFLYGGCGIRTVMDLYVFRHCVPGFDAEAAHALVKAGGYLAFARAMEQLCAKWFADGAPAPDDPALLAEVETYILDGGIYGNTENRVKVNRVESKNKLAYLRSRLFLPYDHLKFDYPILQKHPILLPFCQVHRWFRLFRGDTSRRIANELKINRGVTEASRSDTRNMLKKLGLTK